MPLRDGTATAGVTKGVTLVCHVLGEAPFLAVDLTSLRGGPGGPGIASPPASSPRRTEPASVRWQFPIGDIRALTAADRGAAFVTTTDDMLHAIDVANGTELWRASIGSHVSPPVLFDDTVFITGGNRLLALDAEEGSEIWSATTGTSHRFSPVVVHDGVLYVGNHNHHVYALSPIDGQVFWRTRMGAPVEARPAVTAGLVFALGRTGVLKALDILTGHQHWRRSVGTSPGASVTVAAGGVIVTNGVRNLLTCLDATTGRSRWQTQLDGAVDTTPVSFRDTFFVSTADSRRQRSTIHAISAKTGYMLWRVELDTYMIGALSLSDTAVQVGGADGSVRSIDRRTGGIVWTYARPDPFAASSPIVVDDVLYVGGVSSAST